MEADVEGFLYPNADKKLCAGCGLCEKSCPCVSTEPEKHFPQKAFIAQHTDNTILHESTSGGAFTAIAQRILAEGGVVFGAVYDRSLHVLHAYAETEDGISAFRNSKYAQSDLNNAFSMVRKFIESDRRVCFSGTPCQIEGLLKFLGGACPGLVTVDVVCHAVPSPLVFEKYISYMSEKHGALIKDVKFRDKNPYGYKYSQMAHYGKNKELLYYSGVETDIMLRAFFSNICDRPICYACKFKKRYRVSDFTIWDCPDPGLYDKSFDNDAGVSKVLLHTTKARELFSETMNLRKKEISVDAVCDSDKLMTQSVRENALRRRFLKDLSVRSAREVFEKYFPDSVKVKMERGIRKTCLILGVYKPMLKSFKRVGKIVKRMTAT